MAVGSRCSVKRKQVDDDTNFDTLPLKVNFDIIVTSEEPAYVDNIIAKLKQEGITNTRMLKNLSHSEVQTKLMSLSHFSMGETSNIVEVCHRLWRSHRDMTTGSLATSRGHRRFSGRQSKNCEGSGSGGRHGRSRSRGSGGRHRDTSVRGNRNKGSDDKGKTSGPGHDDWKPRDESGPPPVLWKAVEEGDFNEVRRLLQVNECDPDETHKLWTPLMKAAEEGHLEIAQLLLDRGADVHAKNKKGRDSLSFAAAPSMRRKNKDTHGYMLQLLVSR